MRPLLVMQRRDDAGEHPDRILRSAAEQARMQVAIGRLDRHLLVDAARAATW